MVALIASDCGQIRRLRATARCAARCGARCRLGRRRPIRTCMRQARRPRAAAFKSGCSGRSSPSESVEPGGYTAPRSHPNSNTLTHPAQREAVLELGGCTASLRHSSIAMLTHPRHRRSRGTNETISPVFLPACHRFKFISAPGRVVMANAHHHRSDALSSVVALCGIGANETPHFQETPRFQRLKPLFFLVLPPSKAPAFPCASTSQSPCLSLCFHLLKHGRFSV